MRKEEGKPPSTFELLLRSEDVEPQATWVRDRRNIVLLHGFLQDHTCWLTTAHLLRKRYGHSVLLLDWYNHGRSGSPVSPADLSPEALIAQLHQLLKRLEWVGPRQPRRLTLGGCSLGGAIAMLYVNQHTADVDRLVLVAPAGFDEPWHRLVLHLGRLVANALVRATEGSTRIRPSVLKQLVGHAHLVRTTPRYGNTRDWFDSTIARSKPTLLVCAAFDELHRADKWASCREGDKNFRLRILPVNHALLCHGLGCLRLDLDPDAWHSPSPGDSVPRDPPAACGVAPRSRL